MWKVALFLAAVACVLVAVGLLSTRAKQRRSVFLTGAALAAACALLAGRRVSFLDVPADWTKQFRPIQVAGSDEAYASSSSCRDCHPAQFQSWHASYHRKMTQLANPATVLGNFDGVSARAYGRAFHLARRGDEYWVTMDDPESTVLPGRSPIERPIVMTTGAHHLQVYWYATGKDRRLGQLPIVWVNETQSWIPIHSVFLRPPQTNLRSAEGRWNRTCIKCHTTQGRPRIAHQAGTVSCDSQVAEFGIACESCHGPGSDHVRGHRSGIDDPPALINPSDLDHRRSSEVCGQCHGVWTEKDTDEASKAMWNGLSYRPGDRLDETRHVYAVGQPITEHAQDQLNADPDFLRDRFWPDGMVRVSGREYNGLVRSPCYSQGTMSCISCHSMHASEGTDLSQWIDDQLGQGMRGNQACLQCHEDYRDPLSREAHTHHLPDSQGSLCYNCHMPHTTYGLLKAIRSHQITSPQVQDTTSFGRPNACNQCHIDKTLRWTAATLQDWYGITAPTMDLDDSHYAATLQAALQGDAGQRVLAAWSLGWQPALEASRHDWTIPILLQLLDDPYDAVRLVARRSLRAQPRWREWNFDPLATPAQRRQGIAEGLSRWQREGSERSPDSTLLIGNRGQLRYEQLQRLLDKRDHRDVVLAE